MPKIYLTRLDLLETASVLCHFSCGYRVCMTFSGMPRVMTEQVYAKFHGYSPRLRRVMALSFVRGEKEEKTKNAGGKNLIQTYTVIYQIRVLFPF